MGSFGAGWCCKHRRCLHIADVRFTWCWTDQSQHAPKENDHQMSCQFPMQQATTSSAPAFFVTMHMWLRLVEHSIAVQDRWRFGATIVRTTLCPRPVWLSTHGFVALAFSLTRGWVFLMGHCKDGCIKPLQPFDGRRQAWTACHLDWRTTSLRPRRK